MAKNFIFVCGDIGGTDMMIRVAKKLVTDGHRVDFVVDGDGIGYQQLIKQRMVFQMQFAENLSYNDEDADLVFISTCASALNVPKSYAKANFGVRPVVFGADGLFNHGYKWLGEKADYWLAINGAHAQAIRNLRPELESYRVVVTGQPAFDSVIGLIPGKEEIGSKCRQELNISDDENVFLWWSQGMPEVIEEDVEMILSAIKAVGRVTESGVFIPRVHPKLEKIKSGYVQEILGKVESACSQSRVRLVRADKAPSEQLCLASDAIISITCTEDVKNWIMGGPPVIHHMGPSIQSWFKDSLLLRPPYFLPDVENGQALSVRENSEWKSAIMASITRGTRQELRRDWEAPEGLATDKVANFLVDVAS